MENPLQSFAELRDPRVERTRRHLLHEIVLIAIAAILSGAIRKALSRAKERSTLKASRRTRMLSRRYKLLPVRRARGPLRA